MNDGMPPSFGFPAVSRKQVSAAFDGGVLILRDVEKKLGIAARRASCLKDRRDPDLVAHKDADLLRLSTFAKERAARR